VQSRVHKAALYVVFTTPVTSSLLGPNILLNALFSNTLSILYPLNVSNQVSHHTKQGKIIVFYIVIVIFLDTKLEDKRFCTE